jgi:hypothetical protein
MSLSTMRVQSFDKILNDHIASMHQEIVDLAATIQESHCKLARVCSRLSGITEEITNAGMFISACESAEIYGNLHVGEEILLKYRSTILSVESMEALEELTKTESAHLAEEITYNTCKSKQLVSQRRALLALLDGDFNQHESMMCRMREYAKKSKEVYDRKTHLSVLRVTLRNEYERKRSSLASSLGEVTVGVAIHPM